MGRLVIDGSQVYEIDEDCIRQKKEQEKNKRHGKKEDGKKGSRIDQKR